MKPLRYIETHALEFFSHNKLSVARKCTKSCQNTLLCTIVHYICAGVALASSAHALSV